MGSAGIRFTDILTTASSVASYLSEPDVAPQHMLAALDILEGRRRMEDLGRGRSPLAPMPPSRHGGVEPAVRELVQGWFEQLHNDPNSLLEAGQVEALRDQLLELATGAKTDQ